MACISEKKSPDLGDGDWAFFEDRGGYPNESTMAGFTGARGYRTLKMAVC